jgi:hypothetical protein
MVSISSCADYTLPPHFPLTAICFYSALLCGTAAQHLFFNCAGYSVPHLRSARRTTQVGRADALFEDLGDGLKHQRCELIASALTQRSLQEIQAPFSYIGQASDQQIISPSSAEIAFLSTTLKEYQPNDPLARIRHQRATSRGNAWQYPAGRRSPSRKPTYILQVKRPGRVSGSIRTIIAVYHIEAGRWLGRRAIALCPC